MRTIDIKSKGRDKFSADDFNPLIGVSDGSLLTTTSPSRTGVFQSSNNIMPSVSAKSFRMTNSSSNNINVYQKSIVHARYFDETTVGVIPDSPSLKMTTETEMTPLGESQVLKLTHNADTAVFTTTPRVGSNSLNTYVIYFKLTSVDSDLTPLGLYNNKASIDINHPAAAIRIKTDLSIVARVGYNDIELDGFTDIVQLDVWHRAYIYLNHSDFSINVQRWMGGFYVDLVPTQGINGSESFTSIGNGLLSELNEQDEYVIAVASEGKGIQSIDALEVFQQGALSEVLLAGTTKEYFCHRSLDEFSLDGDVSGYYRS